jgi:hypothetical protein
MTMPIAAVNASHLRVTCDGCGADAELCCKRQIPIAARPWAVTKFRAAGWHLDAGDRSRLRSQESALRDGDGKWYCPRCAGQKHL